MLKLPLKNNVQHDIHWRAAWENCLDKKDAAYFSGWHKMIHVTLMKHNTGHLSLNTLVRLIVLKGRMPQ